MSDDRVKKQIEENFTPNFWRFLRWQREEKGPIIFNWKNIMMASAIAIIVITAIKRLLNNGWAPANQLFWISFFLVITLFSLSFVGRTGTKSQAVDTFGNEIDSSNVYGSGRRMTEEEKTRYLEVFPEGSPKGTILGVDPGTGDAIGIPDEDRPYHESLDHRHILMFGGTGRGKTKLLNDRHRQVIYQGMTDIYTDPKGEITEETVWPCADAMRYKNKWLFRFTTAGIHLSNKIDLLKEIRIAKYPGIAANSLAATIMGYKEDFKSADYWGDSVISLLTLSLLAAARCEEYIPIDVYLSTGDESFEPGKQGTWKDAANVFNKLAPEVEEYFRYLMSISKYNEKLLEPHFNTWIGDEKNYRSHIGSVRKKIRVLAEEGVAEVFSQDEIDFDKLVNEPSFLGLIYDPDDSGYFSSAMNLVIQLVVGAIHRNRKTSQKRAIILEELKVTGVIDRLDEHFSFLRGYGTQIIGCTQAYTQLKDLYGEDTADSFFQNTHILFVGGQETKTLKKLEDLTGTYGITRLYSSTSVGGGAVRTTEGEEIVRAPVIDRTELLYMPKGQLFVKLSNCGPIILESYDSSKHPLANVRYVNEVGRYHELSIDELLPSFDPKEQGLRLIGAPAFSQQSDDSYEEEHYLV